MSGSALTRSVSQDIPIIMVDPGQRNCFDTMVSSTRVLISTAGPYNQCGTPLVDACVRLQTHYCDISGENSLRFLTFVAAYRIH